jgi:hypothetical protein
MPNKAFEILRNGNKCTIVFYTNIVSNAVVDGMTGQSVSSWDYEKYELEINYNPSLSAQIMADYNTWLSKAKDAEKGTEAQPVRDYRDSLLNNCDIKHCNPEKWTAMSDSEKLAWATYKQSLRDIPTQDGFPYSVNWAAMPADTANKLSDALVATANEKRQVASLESAQIMADTYLSLKGGA